MRTRIPEIEVPAALVSAVLNQDRIDESPHNLYKYPARFSPLFAREAIKAFTSQGDTILDPFCGGGTSIVEAISLGRHAVGFDVSSLAVFLTRAKTMPISIHDKREICKWAKRVQSLDPRAASIQKAGLTPDERYYHRNLPKTARSFFCGVLNCMAALSKSNQQDFIRLVLLAVGQWALDCKIRTPTWNDFRKQFLQQLQVTLDGQYDYLSKAAEVNNLPRCRLTEMRRVVNRTSEESDSDRRIPADWLPAKLIVTSPPYPGVHVIYHRWQIHGRKETPVPFWLANSRDGAGEGFYCLGRRAEASLPTYFKRLQKSFSALSKLVNAKSLIVQLVAFSEPDWQLPTYLRSMEGAGFTEAMPICDKEYLFDGRIWRHVPGRKWYASQKGRTSSSREVVLFHRLS